MIKTLVLIGCLGPAAAFAQPRVEPSTGMNSMHHMMMHGLPMAMPPRQPAGRIASQVGQGAFAAIQEIVEILAADPKTDWTKVDIDALRRHLIDMNDVTLNANVTDVPIDGGMNFVVTGEGRVRDAIRRMTSAHAAAMNGVDGWRYEAAEIEGGATLAVHAPAKDLAELRGLGFLGVLALGMHHQQHHMMIARGEDPHG